MGRCWARRGGSSSLGAASGEVSVVQWLGDAGAALLTRSPCPFQAQPLQPRPGQPVQQPGPHPSGGPPVAGHLLGELPARRGHRHHPRQPGLQHLPALRRGRRLLRPGERGGEPWGSFTLGSSWDSAPTWDIFGPDSVPSAGGAARGLCWRHPGLRRAVPEPGGRRGQPEQQPPWQPGGCPCLQSIAVGSGSAAAGHSLVFSSPPAEHGAHLPRAVWRQGPAGRRGGWSSRVRPGQPRAGCAGGQPATQLLVQVRARETVSSAALSLWEC